jgi:PAS domain-containing protein
VLSVYFKVIVLSDGIVMVDPSDRLVYANDAAARKAGFPSSTAVLAVRQAGITHQHDKFTVWDE